MSWLPSRPVRRAAVTPLVVVLALALVAASPVLLAVALVVDLLRPRRFPSVRLVAAAAVYAAFEVAALAALLALWVASGFGRSLAGPRSRDSHYAFLRWWTEALYGLGKRILGLRVELEDPPEPRRGPIVVFARHAGPMDSHLLLHALLHRYGRRPRIVMKEDLQWDPVADLIGNRLPNVFLRRQDRRGDRDLAAIRALATGLGDRDALVLFPEGTNYTPSRRRAAIASLRRRGRGADAARAERMTNVMPPRTSGALAAMEGAPEADVVFVAHVGLEYLEGVGALWRRLPLALPVLARYWRLPATEVPREDEARREWLFSRWAEIDRWIERRKARFEDDAVAPRAVGEEPSPP